jgi:hypothetical protein
MLVLVEDATEAVASSYVEAGYLVRICDRDGQGAHRAGVGDALVRSTAVNSVNVSSAGDAGFGPGHGHWPCRRPGRPE